jgi:sec-independent protein translocase protein TatA
MFGDIMEPTHLLFVLIVALLVLGPKRLPEVGRTLGSGMRDFRRAISGEMSDDHHGPERVDSATTEQPHQPSVATEPEPVIPTSWHDDAMAPIHGDDDDADAPDATDSTDSTDSTAHTPVSKPAPQATEPEPAVAQSASDARTDPSA